MLPTIDLDNQRLLRAKEINDVAANPVLAAKLPAGQASRSQATPQHSFGIGRGAPESSLFFVIPFAAHQLFRPMVCPSP
jgi:hypothetical protein